MSKDIHIIQMADAPFNNGASLYLLYYPLIGKDSAVLYSIFCSLSNQTLSVQQMLQTVQMNEAQFISARKKLEQFQLIKTYESDHQLIQVYPPMEANAFLTNDTFSRMYLMTVGSSHFDRMKLHFVKQDPVDGSMTNISEPMDVSMLNTWNEQKEITYMRLRPGPEEALKKYNFDFEEFFKGMDHIFPIRLRTRENLKRIAELADLHGIRAKDMKKYVMRSTNPATGKFDPEKLKSMVFANQTVVRKTEDPYSLSPVEFLVARRNGAPASNADRRLIERLSNEYGFDPGVINVLIEYTLQQTQQKFPKAYVEKVASTWKAQNIQTKEQALEKIKKPVARQTWYNDHREVEPSDELVEQIRQMQDKLKGGNHG